MVSGRLISSSGGFVTSDCIEINHKRNGDEDVILLEYDDREVFQKNMMDACGLLKDDQVLAAEDIYLTVGIFGDSSDFSKSMVFSRDLLRRLSGLNLTLEINTYG